MASSLLSQVLLGSGFVLAYIALLIVYRLNFSPLAKFPGPKIAAITSLYAFYYDVYLGGQFIWAIQAMHEKYGPIVRIRPDVLHVNDPEFIEQLYGSAGKRRDKYKIAINGFATKTAGLGTIEHDLHRSRRAPLNPYFSKQSIRRLDPILQRTLTKVLRNLSAAAKSNKIMRMNLLYSSTTSDIIYDYCFGESSNYLDREDLNEPFFSAQTESAKGYHFACYNPWFLTTLMSLPMSFVIFILPQIEVFLKLAERLGNKIDAVREAQKTKSEGNMSPTIFDGMLTNENLPPSEKTTRRLTDEAIILIGAGTDTTATTLAALTYHILANPAILKKLKIELAEAIPDVEAMPESARVEVLPYLTAVIQEGIRLHPGATLRQERVAPDEDLFYEDSQSGKKYVIKRGIPVGMTAPLISRIESIYPSPLVFNPDRFLENPRLDRYQMAFSRGSRRCLGINLAYAELYIVVAGIFRKYDLFDGTGKQTYPTLELFETGREDVDMVEDHVTPFIRKGSLGVRVRVRSGGE